MSYESFEPCAATNFYQESMVCYHHIHTRKSHPELARKKWNMIPCTLAIHNEFHLKGTSYMAQKYAGVKKWLKKNNWYICEFRKKWVHDFDS